MVLGGEAISVLLREIASGKKQERPRNDIVSLVSEGTYIFTNPKDLYDQKCEVVYQHVYEAYVGTGLSAYE